MTFIVDIRRFILYAFFKKYIKYSLSKRKGKCNHCGCCCEGYDSSKKYRRCTLCGTCCKECDYMKPDGTCKIYKSRKSACYVDFPIDEFEQKSQGVKQKCGYYWD